MNTATGTNFFGFIYFRVDFVRASGACCAIRYSEKWELYKISDGLEMFCGYAAGETATELDRVLESCRLTILAPAADKIDKNCAVETSLDTIAIQVAA